MTFEELVAPLQAERFWSETWERASAHLSGRAAGHHDPVATAAEVDDLLFGSGGLPADSVRLYRGVEEIPATAARDEGTASGLASAAKLRQLHDEGATIVVASVDRFLPRLAATLASFDARFKAKCLAHLVASPAGAQGLAPHSDGYGVFALQIAGAKTWSLHEDMPRATAGHGIDRHELIGRPPSSRVRMTAGDLLYLPRGTVHAAATSDDRSVHLSLALIPPRGADLLSLLGAAAEEDPFFREYLPYGIGETAETCADYADAFRKRLAILAAETDLFALLDRRRAERAASARGEKD